MKYLVALSLLVVSVVVSAQRQTLSFDADWAYTLDGQRHACTLPRAWNEDYAFRVGCAQLPDDTVRYTKTFTLEGLADRRVVIEFEGARQAASVWVNGHHAGLSENGVMAFGFDITPYVREGQNRIEVLTDNDWGYKEQQDAQHSTYQWNNKNFNANYGGLNKHVRLHLLPLVHQTLPLYSNLGTTGTYVYATDFDIPARRATLHVESEVKNESAQKARVTLETIVEDNDGRTVATFRGDTRSLPAGGTAVLKAQRALRDVHFWSWGYGYLYTVRTRLLIGGRVVDEQQTRTGLRKTRFAEGKIWLNDRVIMMHGFAQRSTNEWPAVGSCVPAWMSDYSNGMMVECGANLVRWMHVTPWRQDIESCDRVGLIQAMPAGDSEGDIEGRRWEHRVALMRDAIIYNRNSPSILFYEGGNESISREHMVELRAVRDQYDPQGGRAIGSREMLDIDEAEYGGEMLYINKSGAKPVWAMEYCRDEGYRPYWDNLSYPYHQHGAGPYYRKAAVPEYNQNQDQLTIEQIRRWYDYWVVRPGMGRRVSSGGVKIVFSDTNTHGRSEMNFRTSGVVDAMRTPKDAFYAHRVMWNGWVDTEQAGTYIIGHWNYDKGVRKDVYVVSTSPRVELFLNGKSLGEGRRQYDYLHTFRDVEWAAGTLRAVGLDSMGREESAYEVQTAGAPHHLQLTLIQNPDTLQADGADMALVQVDVVDKAGRRCPTDGRFVDFTLAGPAEWRGGIAKSPDGDNYILARKLPVEAGTNRVLLRSTPQAGTITLTARAHDLPEATLSFSSVKPRAGQLPSRLGRGETPLTPSYTDKKETLPIVSAEAGFDTEHASRAFDDNELSEWKNDGRAQTAWIKFHLAQPAAADELSLKLTGWRGRSYPLAIYADTTLVWSGQTPKSLGYVSLRIPHPVKAQTYTIRQTGRAQEADAFGGIVEVAATTAGELDLYKTPNSNDVKSELRIVEVDFLRDIR